MPEGNQLSCVRLLLSAFTPRGMSKQPNDKAGNIGWMEFAGVSDCCCRSISRLKSVVHEASASLFFEVDNLDQSPQNFSCRKN
jgi:hypothetical protein